MAGAYGDTTPQQPTTILGAAKLTGRLPGGLTLGVLDAVTQRVTGRGDTTFEPRANYAVIRARQDLRGGESNVGAMLTAVNRSLDSWSSPYMTRSAYAGAIDFTHRFPGRRYEVGGSLDVSRVDGSRQVIAGLQQDAVHYYQRPDGGLTLDTTRTTLGDPMRRSALRRSAATCCSSRTTAAARRVRDQRHRVPAASRPAGLEHVGGVLRPPQAGVLSTIPVERQLVAVLDDQWLADRGSVQYQHAHDPEEQHERARRWDARRPRHDVLFSCTRGGPALRQDTYWRRGSASTATTVRCWCPTCG